MIFDISPTFGYSSRIQKPAFRQSHHATLGGKVSMKKVLVVDDSLSVTRQLEKIINDSGDFVLCRSCEKRG